MNWPPEHDAMLRKLIEAGETFSAAAREINREFRTEYTRNAAIGRAGRMGLSKPFFSEVFTVEQQAAKRQQRLNRRRQQKQLYRRRGELAASPLSAAAAPGPDPAPAMECAPLGLSLVDLPHDGCKWPITDDPPHRFCGHMRVLGTTDDNRPPYCPHHMRMATRNSERAA
jgi:GcrA cell cycle regulator